MRILGIYIKTHGQLSQSARTIPTPERITIKKYNLGGFGCLSYPVPRLETPEEIATSLTYGDSLVCCQDDYQTIYRGKKDTYGVSIDTENSCEVFEGNDSWIKKTYTFDATRNKLIFAFNSETVNIVDCTLEKFQAFLGVCDASSTRRIESFIARRDETNSITTEDIMTLIVVIQKIYRIRNVTILDESCNILKGKKKTLIKHRGKDELMYCPVPKSQVYRLPVGVGYGGKRKFKTQKNKTRIN